MSADSGLWVQCAGCGELVCVEWDGQHKVTFELGTVVCRRCGRMQTAIRGDITLAMLALIGDNGAHGYVGPEALSGVNVFEQSEREVCL